jgi:hypothetical protein
VRSRLSPSRPPSNQGTPYTLAVHFGCAPPGLPGEPMSTPGEPPAVCGQRMVGLLTARVLSDFFRTVALR